MVASTRSATSEVAAAARPAAATRRCVGGTVWTGGRVPVSRDARWARDMELLNRFDRTDRGSTSALTACGGVEGALRRSVAGVLAGFEAEAGQPPVQEGGQG